MQEVQIVASAAALVASLVASLVLDRMVEG